jgi:tetratricopeptide (TPR) repeat protein
MGFSVSSFKITHYCLLFLLLGALCNALLLNWHEYLRLVIICVGSVLLYRMHCRTRNDDIDYCVYWSRILALVFMFIITQFDPATNALNVFVSQVRFNWFFIFSSLLILIIFLGNASFLFKNLKRKEFNIVDIWVLSVITGVLLIYNVAIYIFKVPLILSDILASNIKVFSYVILWAVMTRTYAQTDYTIKEKYRDTLSILSKYIIVFMVLISCIGAYRVGLGVYYLRVGDQAYHMGQTEAALVAYERVAELQSLGQMIRVENRAYLYILRGDVKSGDEPHFVQLVEGIRSSTSDVASVQLKLGNIFYKAGLFEKASVQYERYLSAPTGKKEDTVLSKLGICYVRLGKEVHWRRLVTLAERFGVVPKMEASNYQEALNLGKVNTFIGKHDAAIAEFENAIAFEPDDPMVHYLLGRTLLSAGFVPKALIYFEMLIEKSTNIADVYYLAGKCYEKQGQKELAREHYRKTVALLANHLDAWKALQRMRLPDSEHATVNEAIAKLTPQTWVNAKLSSESELLGYDLPNNTVNRGQTLKLTLYWVVRRNAIAGPVRAHFFMRGKHSKFDTVVSAVNDGPYFESSQWAPGEVRRIDYAWHISDVGESPLPGTSADLPINCLYELNINLLFTSANGEPEWDWSSVYTIAPLCIGLDK